MRLASSRAGRTRPASRRTWLSLGSGSPMGDWAAASKWSGRTRQRRRWARRSSVSPSTIPTRRVLARRTIMASEGTGAGARARSTASESLSVVALGALRLIQRWPGLLAIPVSYAIAASVLYDRRYGYILSAVIAGAVGVLWYASPLRVVEARRRAGRADGD